MIPLYALLFNTRYSDIQIGLARDGSLFESLTVVKHRASSELLVYCNRLLTQRNLSVKDCSFIGACLGPAPFTTLRVALSTANGLAYACALPMIGVDGLDAFVQELSGHIVTPYVMIVLNAFCDDLYFALYTVADQSVEKGCESVGKVIKRIKDIVSNSSDKKNDRPVITLVGNGVMLHEALVKQEYANKLFIPDPLPESTSLEAICKASWDLWYMHKTVNQLLPLYLKASSALMCPTIDEDQCALI